MGSVLISKTSVLSEVDSVSTTSDNQECSVGLPDAPFPVLAGGSAAKGLKLARSVPAVL
jgi:hypothetical protein